jgi:hypothetical protein
MYGLMIIGLVVCAIGKLKLTPTITLVGIRARWYGITLFISAVPVSWVLRQLLLLLPSQILQNQLCISGISITAVICYIVLLALPFRERKT